MAGSLTSIAGIRVGHAHDGDGLTGCTVILLPPETVGAVDVRGGAPGTRETDLLAPQAIQTWERNPMPGIVFRMEVESNPARTIYALRVDPKLILAESRLAGDFIYEDGKTNGRGTVSEMVRQTGAIGGINGDFFQWTPDPGGDPLGLALSKGQLISAPGSKAKNVALGWGPSLPYTIGGRSIY